MDTLIKPGDKVVWVSDGTTGIAEYHGPDTLIATFSDGLSNTFKFDGSTASAADSVRKATPLEELL